MVPQKTEITVLTMFNPSLVRTWSKVLVFHLAVGPQSDQIMNANSVAVIVVVFVVFVYS